MMSVIACITFEHDLRLVLLAAVICIAGSWCAISLFTRVVATGGLQRAGWLVLSTIAGGATIWCTHFVAMIGYKVDLPIVLDPLITAFSLLIAVIGVGLGFWLATARGPLAPAAGGAIVGLAISAMHYGGMIAYRVQGIVSWDNHYLLASILLAVVFSAAAVHVAVQTTFRHHKAMAAGLFVTAVITLHFTAMTAFRIQPLIVEPGQANAEALLTLALAISGVALLIVISGAASYVIDDRARADSFERIRQLALNDSLTGLPNRASFREFMACEVQAVRRDGGELAMIGIDLDRFKEINDFRGHAAGDEVLKILSGRMRTSLAEGEFIARLGGDEFAAVHRKHNEQSLRSFLDRLEKALTQPIHLDDYQFNPGASMGVAIYPRDAKDLETLLSNADLALYRAKSSKADKICFYEPEMDEAVRARRSLAGDLRDAIASDRLEVHYQVQTSVSTGEIKGFEALLRWNHSERGYIPPAEFIPLAEEEGLILRLGEWVLRRACADALTWDPAYRVAVNFSPLQFIHANLGALVISVLMETGLAPRRLELELTESAIFADRDRALHMLRQIKSLGVSIALDDFGTGYSSLETLRSFPFDKIKLDASFIREVERSPQAIAIVRAVLALGKSLDIPVLAEGIETEGQLALLHQEGCDEAQGFLLGRPATLPDILEKAKGRVVRFAAGR
ncbi:putative bifunctional diguanylate cyclase/phosphodiesterase [Mesorhizobium retamae]|uniref:EAL domain-containing protein n=1 Tax=Mesorhizobium retamae TaxID=2912854 RepID=A0ABS9QNS7_9HYPH|nr:bifunctional diguanylate cyclase/phosphodiesterase [Mesorhizobium sp. IRAMC:0171]MCG7509105.1 EAL domain-containing protein [Mesorhizobium sp. IRAMC:0171]